MTSDIDQLWLEQQDDVFNVVADIDPQSSRIEYAFKAGSVAVAAQWEEFDYERDNPKRLVEHVLALMVERDKAQALAASLSEEMHRLAKGVERLQSERDRLIRALYMVGNVELLAQCPCCLAERTNGEHHSSECALGAGVED